MNHQLLDEIETRIELGPEEYDRQRRRLMEKGKMIGWLIHHGYEFSQATRIMGQIFALSEDDGGFGEYHNPDGKLVDRWAHYRDYIIRHDNGHWEAAHVDYDGAPYETGGPPADNRCVSHKDLASVLDQIDELEEL